MRRDGVGPSSSARAARRTTADGGGVPDLDLLVLRHGEAGKRIPASRRDAERSLTEEGREEVEEVVKAIASLKLKPDVIVTSPLKRAHETGAIATKVLKGKKGDLQVWDELKPEGSKAEFFKRLSTLKPESLVLCIGHEPYLTEMIDQAVSNGRSPGGGGHARMALRKSGLARIEITRFNPRVEGELRWLLTPKLLRRIS